MIHHICFTRVWIIARKSISSSVYVSGLIFSSNCFNLSFFAAKRVALMVARHTSSAGHTNAAPARITVRQLRVGKLAASLGNSDRPGQCFYPRRAGGSLPTVAVHKLMELLLPAEPINHNP